MSKSIIILRIIILQSLLSVCSVLFSQITILSQQTYDAGALYGYMNGGSELYKEYNFKKLTVKELKIDGQELKFECFEMDSPVSAYGIFSVNVFKCKPCERLILSEVCCSDYQLQAVNGNCYLSIINTNGSVAAQDAAHKVLNDYIQKGEEKISFKPPSYIKKLNPSKVMLMNGHLAIANRADNWLKHYNTLDVKTCYILKWKGETASMMVFSSENKKVLNINSKKGITVKIKKGTTFILKHDENDPFTKQLLKKL